MPINSVVKSRCRTAGPIDKRKVRPNVRAFRVAAASSGGYRPIGRGLFPLGKLSIEPRCCRHVTVVFGGRRTPDRARIYWFRWDRCCALRNSRLCNCGVVMVNCARGNQRVHSLSGRRVGRLPPMEMAANGIESAHIATLHVVGLMKLSESRASFVRAFARDSRRETAGRISNRPRLASRDFEIYYPHRAEPDLSFSVLILNCSHARVVRSGTKLRSFATLCGSWWYFCINYTKRARASERASDRDGGEPRVDVE